MPCTQLSSILALASLGDLVLSAIHVFCAVSFRAVMFQRRKTPPLFSKLTGGPTYFLFLASESQSGLPPPTYGSEYGNGVPVNVDLALFFDAFPHGPASFDRVKSRMMNPCLSAPDATLSIRPMRSRCRRSSVQSILHKWKQCQHTAAYRARKALSFDLICSKMLIRCTSTISASC